MTEEKYLRCLSPNKMHEEITLPLFIRDREREESLQSGRLQRRGLLQERDGWE